MMQVHDLVLRGTVRRQYAPLFKVQMLGEVWTLFLTAEQIVCTTSIGA